jgi:hypothetical protein
MFGAKKTWKKQMADSGYDCFNDEFGSFTQTLSKAFLYENYGIEFFAGDENRKMYGEDLLEFLIGKYVPPNVYHGPRIIVNDTELTMPDFFMYKSFMNSDFEYFDNNSLFWIENKSSSQDRTFVSIKKNLFSDYVFVDDESGFSVGIAFLIPTERKDKDNFLTWDFDFYFNAVEKLNRIKTTKDEYPEMFWWRLRSCFKKLNSFPLNYKKYFRYFDYY